MKKVSILLILILSIVIGNTCIVSAADTEIIKLTAFTKTGDNQLTIKGSVTSTLDKTHITMMASEMVSGSYSIDNMVYIDQIDNISNGDFTININTKENLKASASYIIRVGSNASKPVWLVLKTDSGGSTEYIYGDVDKDGAITANDAALVMQYVLNSSSIDGIITDKEEFLILANVTNDTEITASQASCIYQKALNNSFIMPVEVASN